MSLFVVVIEVLVDFISLHLSFFDLMTVFQAPIVPSFIQNQLTIILIIETIDIDTHEMF